MAAAMAREAQSLDPMAPGEEVVVAQERVARAAAGFGLKSAMPFGTQYGMHPLPPEEQVDSAWASVAPTFDVLIGSNAREVAFFTPVLPPVRKLAAVPAVGPALSGAVVKFLTRRIYGAPAAAFARRHQRGGGRAWRYTITWGAPGNPFAAAHTIDLPLLFGNQAVWKRSPLVAGASWAEVDNRGRQLRQIWADFSRSGEAPADDIDGLVRIRPA